MISNSRQSNIFVFLLFLGILFLLLYIIPVYYVKFSSFVAHTSFVLENKELFFIWTISVMLVYYLLFSRKAITFQNFKKIIILYFITSVILIAIYPLNSSDVYGYIFRARILNHYGANPYLHPPAEFYNDKFFNYTVSGFDTIPYPYGPVWLLPTSILNRMAKDNIGLNLFLFRFFVFLINTGCIFLIYRIASRIKNEKKYLITGLYALNPIILLEAINNSHVDILMIFFVFLAIYFYIVKKDLFSFLFLLLSILTKFFTLIILPVMLILYLKRKNMLREKIKFVILAGIISLNVVFILSLPYLPLGSIFKGFIINSQFWGDNTSALIPFILLYLVKKTFFVFSSFVNFFDLVSMVKIVSVSFFLLFYAKIILSIKKIGGLDLIKQILTVLILFFFFAAFFVPPWYLTILIPFVVFLEEKTLLKMLFFISLLWSLDYMYNFSLAALITLIVLLLFELILDKGFIKGLKRQLIEGIK